MKWKTVFPEFLYQIMSGWINRSSKRLQWQQSTSLDFFSLGGTLSCVFFKNPFLHSVHVFNSTRFRTTLQCVITNVSSHCPTCFYCKSDLNFSSLCVCRSSCYAPQKIASVVRSVRVLYSKSQVWRFLSILVDFQPNFVQCNSVRLRAFICLLIHFLSKRNFLLEKKLEKRTDWLLTKATKS